MRQVNNSVATVMPEMGFDEDPISPVRRADTTTNKKPKSTIRTAAARVISNEVGRHTAAALRVKHRKGPNSRNQSQAAEKDRPHRKVVPGAEEPFAAAAGQGPHISKSGIDR